MRRVFGFTWIFLVLYSGAWADSVPDASEGNVQPADSPYKYIRGVAIGVSRDGFIDLRDSDTESEVVKLRPWALEVVPEALATVVNGRRLECLIVYENQDHVAGQCVLFWAEQLHQCTFQSHVFCHSSQASLDVILINNFVAQKKCTKLDYDNIGITIIGDQDFTPYPEKCAEFEEEN